jgi:hypothetical protein
MTGTLDAVEVLVRLHGQPDLLRSQPLLAARRRREPLECVTQPMLCRELYTIASRHPRVRGSVPEIRRSIGCSWDYFLRSDDARPISRETC